MVAGQGGEPAIQEEAEAVRHRWRPTSKEGPPPVRQVGQGHAHPPPAPHPQIAPQGAPAPHEFTRTLDKNLGIYKTCLFILRWTRNPQCPRLFSCCAVLF